MELQIGDLVRSRAHPDQIIGLVTRKGTNGWVKVTWIGFVHYNPDTQEATLVPATQLELLSKNFE